MRGIVLSDVHGDTEMVAKIMETIKKPDFAILCGDLSNYGDKMPKEVVEAIGIKKVFGVPGNMDTWDILEEMEAMGISIHGKNIELEGVKIAGFGGGIHNHPGRILHSEKEILEGIENAAGNGTKILVTHLPPINTNIDLTGKGIHAGSAAVRDAIEKLQPELHLCGHIHDAKGETRIGKTKCINVGPVKEGNALLIKLGKKITVKRIETE